MGKSAACSGEERSAIERAAQRSKEMSESTEPCRPDEETEEVDPARERIQADRRPGEMDSAMASGWNDGDISATERFEGEMTRREALEALKPDRAEASPAPRAEPASQQAADPPRRKRSDR